MSIQANRLHAGVALALATACAGAWAQSSERAGGLEEIVVTAQKRAESVQDVPIAVSAFSAEELLKNGMNNWMYLQNHVPSLILDYNYGSVSTPKMWMRGVGVDNQVFSFDSPIGLYIDGVYLARITGAMVDLFDVDRVEVLRGPQGTLYGRNSSVGAVAIHTKLPPLDEKDFSAAVTAGSYGQLNGQFTLGLPLVDDTLGMRVSFDTRNNDGFQKNSTTGRHAFNDDIDAVRAALRWQPTDDLDITLRGDYMRDHSDNAVGVFFRNPDLSLNPDVDLYRFDESANTPLVNEIEPWGLSGTIEWSTSAFDLTSITAYRALKYRNAGDVDGNSTFEPVPGLVIPLNSFEVWKQDLDEDQFTQEVFLSSPGEGAGRIQWVAGMFYFTENNDFDWSLAIYNAPPPITSYHQDTTSYAPYAQITWPLADRLSLTTGLRYTYEKKELSATQHAWDGTPTPDFDFADDKTAKKTNYRVSLDYKINDDVLLYASNATGFRSGGFNGSAFDLEGISSGSFGPEDSNVYEIGIKSDLWGRRVRLNADYFYAEYSHLQQAIVDLQTGAITTTNVNATVQGPEVEATALLTENWDVNLTLSHMDDDIEDSDAQLKHTPEWSWRLGTAYTLPVAPLQGNLRFAADVAYSSEYYDDSSFNLETLKTDAYYLVNASIGYNRDDGRWSLMLQGLNLSDETYIVGGFDIFDGIISSVWYPSMPRRYMLTAQYRL